MSYTFINIRINLYRISSHSIRNYRKPTGISCRPHQDRHTGLFVVSCLLFLFCSWSWFVPLCYTLNFKRWELRFLIDCFCDHFDPHQSNSIDSKLETLWKKKKQHAKITSVRVVFFSSGLYVTTYRMAPKINDNSEWLNFIGPPCIFIVWRDRWLLGSGILLKSNVVSCNWTAQKLRLWPTVRTQALHCTAESPLPQPPTRTSSRLQSAV